MSPSLKHAVSNGNLMGKAELARVMYQELRASGCGTEDVLAICTQIIDEITSELSADAVRDAEATAA
ncbi:MAG: hypothetical protein HY904_24145 [Deltaproteobacteria bacterium]|nr:hypothetical protein [Deltaproteobacteria bacterium]